MKTIKNMIFINTALILSMTCGTIVGMQKQNTNVGRAVDAIQTILDQKITLDIIKLDAKNLKNPVILTTKDGHTQIIGGIISVLFDFNYLLSQTERANVLEQLLKTLAPEAEKNPTAYPTDYIANKAIKEVHKINSYTK